MFAQSVGSLINYGSIYGQNGGVNISDFSRISLTKFGGITSETIGLLMRQSSAENRGDISGGGIGVKRGTFDEPGSIQPPDTLENYGTISGKYGVSDTHGVVINFGTIAAGNVGVSLYFKQNTLDNSGDIFGSVGVFQGYGATVTNTGKISAGLYGVVITSGPYAPSSLNNSGDISSPNVAVKLEDATLVNSGTISGGKMLFMALP